VPITFWIAGPLGVTGLILALVGRARVKRREGRRYFECVDAIAIDDPDFDDKLAACDR
jgi:hypothetical protein